MHEKHVFAMPTLQQSGTAKKQSDMPVSSKPLRGGRCGVGIPALRTRSKSVLALH